MLVKLESVISGVFVVRKWLVVPLAILLGQSALGADLKTAFEDALQNDPVLASAIAQDKISREGFPVALSSLLPQVSVSAGRGENTFERTVDAPSIPGFPNFSEGKSENERWSVSVSQTVFNAGSWLNLMTSRIRLQIAEQTLIEAQQSLVIRTAQAYVNVLRGQDRLESSLAAEEAVERQLEQAQQRFDVGLVAITDVLNTTAAYDNAKVATIDASQTHGIFFESLSTITGVKYDQIHRISEDLPITNPNPSNEEDWVRDALENNTNLIIAEKNLLAARNDRRQVWTIYMPNLAFSASKTHSRDPLSFLGEETESDSLNLNINIPVFQGGRVLSQHRSAAYGVEAAKHNVTLQRLTIARDTRNLYRAVVTDVIRVMAKKKAIESNQAALEATQTGYEVGTRNVVDVLLAQQQLYGAIFDYADSRYNYIMNGLALQQAVGNLAADDIELINQFTTADDPVTQVMSISGR